MIEVEIKLPISAAKETMTQKLRDNGFVPRQTVKETDLYFTGTDRDLKQRGEALRIREILDLESGASQAVMTFKGQKLDAVSMTRQEVETEVGSLSAMQAILEAIGFVPVAPVEKIRQYWQGEAITACLDEVTGLGLFLELECLVQTKAEQALALQKLEHMLETLGYCMADTTRTSYLSLLQNETDD